MAEINLTGLKCPLPIIRLNQIVKELRESEEIYILADDPAFYPDVQAWCRKTGNELMSCIVDHGCTWAIIRKCGSHIRTA